MTTMQTLVLGALDDAAQKHAGRLVVDFDWGNTGYARFIPAGSLTPQASLWFEFDKNSCRFGPRREPVASLCYDGSSGSVQTVERLVEIVTNHLTGAP